MDTIQWFYLDPDNNKRVPLNGDGSVALHCIRCIKPFKHYSHTFPENVVRVRRHEEHPWVTPDNNGTDYVGKECWDKIKKNPVSTGTTQNKGV